ncbi:ribosome biogenesis factor YjgA [Marinospirillum sp. MEB164]|uniref:Dual-action ribosomal maturation protein DarP n=1 Tax=Marinospirillum alkalitolerans TaxID=3123374 RepID=A0ABW8PYC8_9GAMM
MSAPQQDTHEDSGPSKSELKRQALALQDLGKKLLDLNKEQLKQLPLDDLLLETLREYHRISSHEARRRLLQRIGKLLRSADHERIQLGVDRFDASSDAYAQHFQQLEHWRERLITEDSALQEFVALWPECEVQLLRQLIRNARKERAEGKPPAQARKIFRLLRDLAEKPQPL